MPDVTPAQLAQQITDYIGKVSVRDGLFYSWMNGTADGGPNGDGKYPLTDLSGYTRYIESPSKMAARSATDAATATAAATAAQGAAVTLGVLGAVLTTGGALPYTVTGVSGGAGTGAGGVPGEYLLTPSGAYSGLEIYGTVGADGKVTGAYRIARSGLSTSSAVPSLAWPSAAGFTTAPTAPTATVAVVPVGRPFWAISADYLKLNQWVNVGGVLTASNAPNGVQISTYLAAGIDAAVTPAANLALNIKSALGSDFSDVTSMTVGDTASTATASNTNVYMSKPTTKAGFITSVTIGVNGSGTGTLFIFTPNADGTYRVAYTQAVTLPATGLNTVAVTASPFLPVGARFGYKRVTGGSLYYNAGGNIAPYVLASAIANVGDTTAVPTTTAATMSLQFSQTYAPTPLSTQIAAATSAAALATSAVTTIVDNAYPNALTIGTPGANALTSSTSYYYGTIPFSTGGRLRQVQLNTVTGGTGKIVAMQLAGSNATVLYTWNVTTTGGTTIDTFGTETFGVTFLPANVSIFYVPVTSGVLRYNSGGTASRVAVGASTTPGAVNPYVSTVATVSIGATIGYASTLSALRQSDKSLQIERQLFTGTTPSTSWSLTGWTWNNGLFATGTGWTNQAIYASPSVAADRTIRCKVVLAAATDKVGLMFNCSQTVYGGAAALINGATNALEMYSLDSANAATLAETVALPTGFLVAGETYVIEMWKVRLTQYARLTRSKTRQTVSWSRAYQQTSDTRDLMRFFGSPALVCLAGTPEVVEFDYSVNVKSQPWCIIIGDSICEGSSMGVATTNWQNCWSYLFDNERGRDDVMIGARGGDTTPNFLSRMAMDLSIWAPKYVLIQIGTNDSSQTVWRNNVAIILDVCRSIGAIPILATFVPRPAFQSRINAQNADIKSNYFGAVDYIDFAAACSVNNDGVTLNSSLFVGDDVHPNTAGNAAMYAQLKVDAPYLLD